LNLPPAVEIVTPIEIVAPVEIVVDRHSVIIVVAGRRRSRGDEDALVLSHEPDSRRLVEDDAAGGLGIGMGGSSDDGDGPLPVLHLALLFP
jgi:hypothetical protein